MKILYIALLAACPGICFAKTVFENRCDNLVEKMTDIFDRAMDDNPEKNSFNNGSIQFGKLSPSNEESSEKALKRIAFLKWLKSYDSWDTISTDGASESLNPKNEPVCSYRLDPRSYSGDIERFSVLFPNEDTVVLEDVFLKE